MALQQEITVTVKGYTITLSKPLTLFVNDSLDLVITLKQFGITNPNNPGTPVSEPFDLTNLSVIMYVEAPNGVDELESTNVVESNITFHIKPVHTRVAGKGKMQIVLLDRDGGRLTLPSFEYEVKETINDVNNIPLPSDVHALSNETRTIIATSAEQYVELGGGIIELSRIKMTELPKVDTVKNTDIVLLETTEGSRTATKENLLKEVNSDIRDIVTYQVKSNIDHTGKEHDTLDSRLQADYAMMMDRFNKASLLPYEAEFITASNSYEGKTTGNVIKGRTLQNLYLVRHREALADRLYTTSYATSVSHNFSAGKYTIINSSLKPELKNKCLSFGVFKENNYVRGVGISNGKTSAVVTLEEGEYIHQVVAGFNDGWSEADLNYLNVIILKGDVGTLYDYQPHFEGIKSVNEDGETLEEVSCGKNLLDSKKLKEFYNATYELINKDGRECLKPIDYSKWRGNSLPIKFKPNTQYTFKYDVFNETPTEGTGLYFRINYTDGTSSNIIYTASNKWISPSVTSLPNKTIDKIWLTYGVTSSVVYFDLNSFRLNEGTGIVDEPYVEDRLSIKMKNLRSLPSGVCDTSDGVRRIGKVVLNGSENWGGIDVDSTNTIRINSTNFLECITIHNNVNIINDKLPSKYIFSSDEEGIFITRAIGNKGNIYIRVLKNKLATQDIAGFKAWLQANPITLYYELETPTKEEGNVEQLRTYDGTTNIFTEGSLIEPTITCKIPSNVQAVVMNLRSENEALNNDINTLQTTSEENNLSNIETNIDQEARLTMLELGVI